MSAGTKAPPSASNHGLQPLVSAATAAATRPASTQRGRRRVVIGRSLRECSTIIHLDPGGFAPAAPPRLRSRGPTIPAPLRRARPWRASPVTPPAHNEYKILAASRITG